jgi:uncharacterized protein (TIGR03545 family)
MKWVRWRGLAAFVVVVIVVVGACFLVVDSAIEAVIETRGTRMVGAEVELEEADLSIFPLGLFLTGLQVTDPDSPMTNAVQVDRIALLVEGAKLFRRKVIVKEMTLEGVRLNTPRKRSGAIPRQPSAEPGVSKRTPNEKLALPSLEAPDAKEILKREKLRSLELAESLKADLQAEKDDWRQRLGDLADEAKLAEYRQRIENLKSAKKGGLEGLLGAVSEVMAVRKDLRKDLDRIKTQKKELKKSLASYRKRVDEVAEASRADALRLKEKYALTPEGLANVSRLLFGEKISRWTDAALRWYERLRPVLERAKEEGQGPEAVKPYFLIRIAHVSMATPAGSIEGEIRNITPDQDVMGLPLTYDFSGENLKGLRSAELHGELNHIDPSSPRDTADLKISGYGVADLSLSDGPELPIVLKKADADFRVHAALAGQALEADLLGDLHSVEISTGMKKGAGSLAKALTASFSDVKEFSVKADISGTLKDYDVKLSSDLDRVLEDAVGKQVKAQLERLEEDLMAEISKKVGVPMDELKAILSGLDAMDRELASRHSLGDDLLKGTEKRGRPDSRFPG